MEVALLIAILVVVVAATCFLAWMNHANAQYLQANLLKSRERQTQESRRVEGVLQQAAEASESVINRVDALAELVWKLESNINLHNVSVNSQVSALRQSMRSDVLSARRDELIRTKELKDALERFISVTKLARQTPEAKDVLALESAENRIRELEEILADLNKL